MNVTSFAALSSAISLAKTQLNGSFKVIMNGVGNYSSSGVLGWSGGSGCSVLIVNGNGRNVTGSGSGQFMTVGSGYSLQLENITLVNYKGGNGGVISSAGILIVKNSTLMNTTATNGVKKINVFTT